MTPHLLFFFVDCIAWILAGVFIGTKLYPNRNANIYDKLPFTAGTTFTSTSGGLFYTMDKGLPETGFAFANLLFAVIVTITVLWIFNTRFRKKYSKRINSAYINYIKPRTAGMPKIQFPHVIRFT